MKMLQESEISKVKFKEEKLSIQEKIVQGHYAFKSLLDLMLHTEYKEKAAWIMSGVVEERPQLLGEQEVDFLLNLLDEKVSKGVERNIWRALEFIKIPINHQERCIHLAFETLERKDSSIAVQVFAMSSAFALSRNQSDLQHILKEILMFKMENASKGFQSRARKILSKLN